MPLHNDYISADSLTFSTSNLRYATMTNPYVQECITTTNPYVHDNFTLNADSSILEAEVLGNKIKIALDRVLDQYFRKIYRVIESHSKIDISEDEFMNIVMECDNAG